jgi:hypothetical protein
MGESIRQKDEGRRQKENAEAISAPILPLAA